MDHNAQNNPPPPKKTPTFTLSSTLKKLVTVLLDGGNICVNVVLQWKCQHQWLQSQESKIQGLFDISLCNMVIKTLFLGRTLRDSGIFWNRMEAKFWGYRVQIHLSECFIAHFSFLSLTCNLSFSITQTIIMQLSWRTPNLQRDKSFQITWQLH